MAVIMSVFERIKREFDGIGRGRAEQFIPLPNPLHTHTDHENGIADGEIRITE
jgi:hypothetical protein